MKKRVLPLELTWLRGVHHLFVMENGLPYWAILHFHVSSRECSSDFIRWKTIRLLDETYLMRGAIGPKKYQKKQDM